MNRILTLISLSLLLSCNTKKEHLEIQDLNNPDTITKKNTEKYEPQKEIENQEFDSITDREISLKNEFKNFQLLKLSDTIKSDLNGDKISDFAFFTNNNGKREIFILDGKSKKKIKIGQDKSFGDRNDFNWVTFWGTTDDKETFEILTENDEIIGDTITKLTNKSIFVRKEEVGGGVITYKDNRYIWIHQSD